MASEETTSKYRRWLPFARNFWIEWLCHMDENFVKGKTDRKYSALYCHIPDAS